MVMLPVFTSSALFAVEYPNWKNPIPLILIVSVASVFRVYLASIEIVEPVSE